MGLVCSRPDLCVLIKGQARGCMGSCVRGSKKKYSFPGCTAVKVFPVVGNVHVPAK
jgi:hypothetical protein